MKKASTKNLPVMQCFLACESVSESSGKRSLHSLFDNIFLGDFPSVFKPFFVFARLWGGSGKHTIAITCIGPDGKQFGKAVPMSAKLALNAGAEIGVQIGTLPLLKPGVLTFALLLDGKPLGWPLRITIGKAPKGAK